MTPSALRFASASTSGRAFLKDGHVYELVGSTEVSAGPSPGVPVVKVRVFTSEKALSSWLASTRNDRAAAVLFDPEAWPRTPAAEQRGVVAAMLSAGAAASRDDDQLLVSPGLDLTRVLDPSVKPRWKAYLALGLARQAALAAPVVIVQAQSLERNPATYARFVAAAAAQARAARQNVLVLAGLSTNPPGAVVTLSELEASLRTVGSEVTGFWLNIPQPGAACPTCNVQRGDLGSELVAWLARDSGHVG